MRVALYDKAGSVELINQSEPDWKYTPCCEAPEAIARQAMVDDSTPEASRVRALLANSLFASGRMDAPGDNLIRALEGALRSGSIRLTGWRSSAPEPLARYTPPPKPKKVQQAPPRITKPGTSGATPEEGTDACAECLLEASRQGAGFIA